MLGYSLFARVFKNAGSSDFPLLPAYIKLELSFIVYHEIQQYGRRYQVCSVAALIIPFDRLGPPLKGITFLGTGQGQVQSSRRPEPKSICVS